MNLKSKTLARPKKNKKIERSLLRWFRAMAFLQGFFFKLLKIEKYVA
jgi:hypothetical protein